MSLVLNESLVLAKTRSQDLKSVLKLNCWGSGIKDATLVRQLVNVEVIGLSCNEITTLEDFAHCHRLRELILRKNKIKSIAEVAHLQSLPRLTSLWLGENPCAENTHNYRKVVLKALPNLTVLDNIPVTREELQEIEELGNEIYEEVAYESSHSSGSHSGSMPAKPDDFEHNHQPTTATQPQYQQQLEAQPPQHCQPQQQHQALSNQNLSSDYFQQATDLSASQHNDSSNMMPHNQETTAFVAHHPSLAKTQNSVSRLSMTQSAQSRSCLSSQGSITTLNGSGHQQQSWPSMNNNNNNNILPKGGKSRNANILSAVLCLVKELDYVSCEVVLTALHCRMEETYQ